MNFILIFIHKNKKSFRLIILKKGLDKKVPLKMKMKIINSNRNKIRIEIKFKKQKNPPENLSWVILGVLEGLKLTKGIRKAPFGIWGGF